MHSSFVRNKKSGTILNRFRAEGKSVAGRETSRKMIFLREQSPEQEAHEATSGMNVST
jgi:hypothetical protein